jgi:hypothetical protein
MVSLGGIVTFMKRIMFTLLFIVFIPGFVFQIPKDGSKLAVAAVHGLIYALVYTILEVLFSMKRIIMCASTGGMGSA